MNQGKEKVFIVALPEACSWHRGKEQHLPQFYLLCSALREDYAIFSQLCSDQQNKVQAQMSCRAEGPKIVEGRKGLK